MDDETKALLERLRDDVAIWKGEASNRSQGMIDLSLDRAAMGVENSQLREEIERLRALEAEVYNRAIKDAANRIMPTNLEHDWTEYAKIRADAAASIRALAKEIG